VTNQLEYIDEKAAARITDVHPRTLRRWRLAGKVAYYLTPTGRIRYRIDDLIEASKYRRRPANVRKCPQVP